MATHDSTDDSRSHFAAAALKMDRKIVLKDDKHYLIPANRELHELSPEAQELAHQAYLSHKPVLDAQQIKQTEKKAPPKPVTERSDSTLKLKKQPTASTNRSIALMLTLLNTNPTPRPKPEFNPIQAKPNLKKTLKSTDPVHNKTQATLTPGVPIPTVLMQALLRYNSSIAQQIKKLNPALPDRTATPTPFNTKPKPK